MTIADLTYGQKRLVEAARKGGFTIGHAAAWDETAANCAAAGMERAIHLAEELRRAQELIARLEAGSALSADGAQ